MSTAQCINDGIWIWLQPSPVYISADKAFYFQWVDSSGDIRCAKYSTDYKLLQVSHLHAGLQTDDHASGFILPLADGKLLSAYGPHAGGNSFSRLSANAHNVQVWGAEATASTASCTYSNLWQSADTSATIWWLFQDNTGGNQGYKYRTLVEGGSWSADTQLWNSDSGTNQAHMRIAPNGANRVDFLVSNTEADQNPSSIYHFYMTVASNGTPSFFNSAGTSLGSAPFNKSTSNMTRVYDGSTASSFLWDLQIIGGQPACAFAVFPNAAGAAITTTTGKQHQYYQGVFNGSTWSTGLIAEAGDATLNSGVRQDWIGSKVTVYSPGICLDPNDINTVYLSKTYQYSGTKATDCRLEQWVNSSGWSKSADISGSTGTLNIRPYAVRNTSPTQILYCNATSYTGYTSWSGSSIWAYPSLTTFAVKPTPPTWVSANGPTNVLAYYELTETSVGAAATIADRTGTYAGTVVGSGLSVASGTYGNQLTGFGPATPTTYIKMDSLANAFATGGNGRWLAVLFKNTDSTTSTMTLVSLGLSTSNNDVLYFALNNGGTANSTLTQWRDHALGQQTITNTIAAASDGNWHVLAFGHPTISTGRQYFDGIVQVNASAATVGSWTLDQATIGCLRRTSNVLGCSSGVTIGAVLVGVNGPTANSEMDAFQYYLANDLLSGQFGGTRGLTSGSVAPFIIMTSGRGV